MMIKLQGNSSFERSRLKILISCITQEFTAVPRFGILFIYLVSVKICHSVFLPGTKMGVPGCRVFFGSIWESPLCRDNVIQWRKALNFVNWSQQYLDVYSYKETAELHVGKCNTYIILVSNELTRIISRQ